MSDSYIPWASNLPQPEAPPPPIATAFQQGQAFGYDLGQKQAARHALSGVNLGDPQSVNSALTGLLKAGAIDQAKGLTDLAMTRGVNSSALPVVQQAFAIAGKKLAVADQQQGSDQTQSQQPDAAAVQAHQQKVLQDASDAVTDLQSTTDPTQRQVKADLYRDKFRADHVPEGNINEVLGPPQAGGAALSDDQLGQHGAFFQKMLNGEPATHPTGFAASNDVYGSPGFKQSADLLNGMFSGESGAILQGVLEHNGIPVSSPISQAIQITQPLRQAQVGLQFAQPTAFAQTVGSRQAEAAQPTPPAPGATAVYDATGKQVGWHLLDGTVQTIEQAAQAQAQGGVSTTNPPAGGRVVGAPENPLNPKGVEPTPGYTGPLGATAGAQAAAAANVAAAAAFEGRAGDVPTRKANLANLRTLADEFSSGPQSGFWKTISSIAAEYGAALPLVPKPTGKNSIDAAAAQEEFDKLSTSVLAAQRQAMGLPVTDQSVSITTGATPNERMTPKGIARVLGVMEGNEDYINAERQAWQAWKEQGHGYETWAQFQPQFNRAFDPRVFQAQYMTADEAAKVRSSIRNYDDQVKVAKRLGYLGAQQ